MVADSPRAQAIVVAAGRSERMGGADKIFTQLKGRPLIVWTLTALAGADAIDEIVIVCADESVFRMTDLVAEWRLGRRVSAVVAGGATRQASVREGLRALSSSGDVVVVQDGARPLVTPNLIETGLVLARQHGAAVCAIPSRDTVKESSGEPPVVQRTPDRGSIWLAQTPQCFERSLLIRAHDEARDEHTDDAALVEGLGHPVILYEGNASNIKVTTPDDLVIAEALLAKRFAEL